MPSAYYTFVVMDIEGWSARQAVTQQLIVAALRRLVRDLLVADLGLSTDEIRMTGRGDGFIIALPGRLPKEAITEAITLIFPQRLESYNLMAPPAESFRVRVAVHAGDAIVDDDGQWSGIAITATCRLVDADVLRRALRASPGSMVVVAVSESWHESVMAEGFHPEYGWRRVRIDVKDFSSSAWISVPGLSSPLGLTRDDLSEGPSHGPRERDSQGQARSNGRAIINFYGSARTGDVVAGDKNINLNTHSYE